MHKMAGEWGGVVCFSIHTLANFRWTDRGWLISPGNVSFSDEITLYSLGNGVGAKHGMKDWWGKLYNVWGIFC